MQLKSLLTIALVSALLTSSCICYTKKEISHIVQLCKVSEEVLRGTMGCFKALDHFRVKFNMDNGDFNHFFTFNHADLRSNAKVLEGDLPAFISLKNDPKRFEETLLTIDSTAREDARSMLEPCSAISLNQYKRVAEILIIEEIDESKLMKDLFKEKKTMKSLFKRKK